MPSPTSIFTILALALTTLAKTDLTGCTSSNVVTNGGASVLWYVPSDGEICAFLDCGGGMAPPKTDVPGCAAYSGTASYSPSYIPGWGSATATATASGMVSEIPSASYGHSSAWSTGVSSETLGSATVVKATTVPAVISSPTHSAVSGALTFDTSSYSGTLSHAFTPTAAATSASASNEAGVVRLGRDTVLMVAGAVVGVALL